MHEKKRHMANPTRVNQPLEIIDTVDATASVEFDATFIITDNHRVKQCDPSHILLQDGMSMSDLSKDQAMAAPAKVTQGRFVHGYDLGHDPGQGGEGWERNPGGEGDRGLRLAGAVVAHARPPYNTLLQEGDSPMISFYILFVVPRSTVIIQGDFRCNLQRHGFSYTACSTTAFTTTDRNHGYSGVLIRG